MSQELVILVDQHDNERGVMEKMQAHQLGELHRALSVFIFNSQGDLLLHQRAKHKYHSGGLWTNTCCSHPRPGELVLDAANRRLKEEMGMACTLREALKFVYKADVSSDLIEYEFDHVFIGESDDEPHPDIEEVADWKWVSPAMVRHEMTEQPEKFTAWFKLVFEQVLAKR
ncbi:MAG: isopentenyl-diphosphate Delta-isomerase [Bacteroidia bacterium]